MTQYIKATVEGMFPIEDIPLMAQFYCNIEGLPLPETEDEQRDFVLDRAKKVLIDFLKAPSLAYYTATSKAELETNITELETRVAQALSIDYEVVG